MRIIAGEEEDKVEETIGHPLVICNYFIKYKLLLAYSPNTPPGSSDAVLKEISDSLKSQLDTRPSP